MATDRFSAHDYRYLHDLLSKAADPAWHPTDLKALLSNNFNVILGALEEAARSPLLQTPAVGLKEGDHVVSVEYGTVDSIDDDVAAVCWDVFRLCRRHRYRPFEKGDPMKLRDIKPGMKLKGIADYAGGCINEGGRYKAFKTADGEIAIKCGRHMTHTLKTTADKKGDIPELEPDGPSSDGFNLHGSGPVPIEER